MDGLVVARVGAEEGGEHADGDDAEQEEKSEHASSIGEVYH